MSTSLKILRSLLPEYAHEYLDQAAAGDVKAVTGLVIASPHNLRATVLVQLHNALGPSHSTVRGVLAAVWRHNHHYLLHDLGRKRTQYFLRWCGALPADPPPKLTVWRGGRGGLASVSRGWSWTTDRDTAIWFGAGWRIGDPGKEICVAKATISSSRIVHHENERGEHEVVIFGCKGAEIDGNADEWVRRAHEVEADRQAEDAARLAEYSVAAA